MNKLRNQCTQPAVHRDLATTVYKRLYGKYGIFNRNFYLTLAYITLVATKLTMNCTLVQNVRGDIVHLCKTSGGGGGGGGTKFKGDIVHYDTGHSYTCVSTEHERYSITSK